WATPILPMLLFARITLRAWRKGRHRRELLLSLPYIVLFTLSGSFGELIGYLRGPGDSLLRIA
ncbi:MAG: glycosyl transferase, partial [Chloroflexota bacterium]